MTQPQTNQKTGPTCTQCAMPLAIPSSSSLSMRCPRCNTWQDLDPSCAGSCLSCHKTVEAKATPCTAEKMPVEHPISNSCDQSNNSCGNVAHTKRGANLGPLRLLKQAWNVLTNRPFL